MPEIGDIKCGKDIGYKRDMKFIWTACDICKKERWVHYVKGKAETAKCVACCKIGKKIYRAKQPDATTKAGDIKLGYEIGCKCNDKYICEPCLNCGVLRWHQIDSKHKYKKCYKCINKGKLMNKNGMWKGGIKINHSGYKMVRLYPNDQFYDMCNKTGYVFEHRLIVAKRIGRSLKLEEVVHHKDNDKSNNSETNLELLPSDTIHLVTIRMQNRIDELEYENNLLKSDMSEVV